MATVTTKPSGLSGAPSGSAKTASSWSLASGGSMVTSGMERQSSRRKPSASMRAGLAASEASMVSGRKRSGMPWILMAMRLIAFSLFIEPSRSRTFATGRPRRPRASVSTLTRSPSRASPRSASETINSFSRSFLSTGTMRPPPRARVFAEHAERPPGGARQQLDHAARIGGTFVRRAARRAAARGRRRRRWADAGPCAAVSRREDDDLRRGSEGLVPFGRRGDQLAVAVARDDVGEHDLGQGAGLDAAPCASARRRLPAPAPSGFS